MMMMRRHYRSVRPVLPVSALACILALLPVSGCNRAGTAGPSVQEQSEQKIMRARDLALAAQRADKDGKVDEAISLYGQAVGEWRDFPAAWTNLGRLLDKRGDAMQAARAYLIAAETSPQSP